MEEFMNDPQSEIVIYQTEDGNTKIDVRIEDETVWLAQAQLCELYRTSKSNISEHIKHIFEEGELEEASVVRKFRTAAAEVIYERADASKPFMGLTVFSGDFPTEKDIGVAKNYLSAEELKYLNNIVSGYFDFAEIQAMRHNPMYMSDYMEHLDNILTTTGENVLQGSGTVSHTQAMEKAKAEYKKYQVQNLSPVEEAYLESIKAINDNAKRKVKEG